MGVFSTITSSVFSELAIVLVGDAVTYLPQEVMLFETLGKMNKIRPFKLVFLLGGWDSSQGEARRRLADALNSVKTKGLLDFLDYPPDVRWMGSHHYGRDTSFPEFDQGGTYLAATDITEL